MLTLNPYLTLKKPQNEEEEEAPQFNEEADGKAPSPRQSEYITHPLLSQTLRKQTEKEISYKVAMYARPTRLKTQFKISTI